MAGKTITLAGETITMAGENGLGDDSGSVNSGSDGLSDHVGAIGERWTMRDDRWGDNWADTMLDGNAGETSGSGKGDSQDGSEDGLQKKIVKRVRSLPIPNILSIDQHCREMTLSFGRELLELASSRSRVERTLGSLVFTTSLAARNWFYNHHDNIGNRASLMRV